jgi:hypothetical protein
MRRLAAVIFSLLDVKKYLESFLQESRFNLLFGDKSSVKGT